MRSKLMRLLMLLVFVLGSFVSTGVSARSTPIATPVGIDEGCGSVINIEGESRGYPNGVHLITGCVHYDTGQYTISGSYTVDGGTTIETMQSTLIRQIGTSLVAINSGTLNVTLIKKCTTSGPQACTSSDPAGSAFIGTMNSDGVVTWEELEPAPPATTSATATPSGTATPTCTAANGCVALTAGMLIRFDNVTVQMYAVDDVALYALGTFRPGAGGGSCSSACFHW
jgi:hypothetical protein